MVLQAILYSRSSLNILNQLELPHTESYLGISTVEQAWQSIKAMQVRGAPAIAIVAALSLAVELSSRWTEEDHDASDDDGLARTQRRIIEKLAYLTTSRPTAVNLADAATKLAEVVRRARAHDGATRRSVELAYVLAAEQMLVDDLRDNQNIGKHGADWIMRHASGDGKGAQVSVVTHCNTGSLATAGYGTALGVIRSLHAAHALKQAFYCETRPYNQGSRLTGYELLHDAIPATLITDSMAAALFRQKGTSERIAAVVVGADRVAANGDTANKIGTYALAIAARFHGVKFLVAAPRTTIDLHTPSGEGIVIEERSAREMTVVKGPVVVVDGEADVRQVVEVDVAARGTRAWNPAFDVTPAELIDGIVTEVGVVEKGGGGTFELGRVFDAEETESRGGGGRKEMPDPGEGP